MRDTKIPWRYFEARLMGEGGEQGGKGAWGGSFAYNEVTVSFTVLTNMEQLHVESIITPSEVNEMYVALTSHLAIFLDIVMLLCYKLRQR